MVDLDRQSPVGAEAPAKDAPLCVEMIHRGEPYSVIVEYEEGGMVSRTGYEAGSCAELGEKVRIEWADYQGLFRIKIKGYYPSRVREPGITWFWMEWHYNYEPKDLRKAFEMLRAGEQVRLKVRLQYNSEAYQCYGSGEPCEHILDDESVELGLMDYPVPKKGTLDIGEKSYEVWTIEWTGGTIVYSPRLKIPLKVYSYWVNPRLVGLKLENEVVGIVERD